MNKYKLSFAAVLVVLFSSRILAQGFYNPQNYDQEDEAVAEQAIRNPVSVTLPRKLIDAPTANMLPRGSFDFDFRAYPRGGIFGAVDIGLTDWFMLGVAYGGENILGEGGVNWNPRVEFNAKVRIIPETYQLPSVALGFDSQGTGAYDDSLKRYSIKSKGFFAVASKNYYWGSIPMGLHGGINYSLENKDKDESVNLYFGTDFTFNEQVVLGLTYDLGLNDNKDNGYYGEGKGYLDLGLRWLYSETFQLEFQLKNLLQNRENSTTVSREFRLIYIEFF
ncbi:MAG: YjbH domain-containing protein [candidate division Zixibacteria bacterium]|nr:YjbH domain-containing protein [candidate division Zixibacteria bacterium]